MQSTSEGSEKSPTSPLAIAAHAPKAVARNKNDNHKIYWVIWWVVGCARPELPVI